MIGKLMEGWVRLRMWMPKVSLVSPTAMLARHQILPKK